MLDTTKMGLHVPRHTEGNTSTFIAHDFGSRWMRRLFISRLLRGTKHDAAIWISRPTIKRSPRSSINDLMEGELCREVSTLFPFLEESEAMFRCGKIECLLRSRKQSNVSTK